MDSDSGARRSERGEHSDALDGLYPVARWYDPCERAFLGSDDLEDCYSWSIRCARALDELRDNLITFNCEHIIEFEHLASVGYSYSFVTAVTALTIAQLDHLALQGTFRIVTEQLAARRLLEFGD